MPAVYSLYEATPNRRDQRHLDAGELLRRYADRALVTSNHIRGETWTYLRRRAGHAAAVDFLDVLERSSRIQVIQVEHSHESTALRWLRGHDTFYSHSHGFPR
ncbi:MAG: PIN domain-containing protein [Gammaproteobacteria bacterium]